MTRTVVKALQLWGLERADFALAAQRENEVWQVSDGARRLALRFHRPGYRTETELASELAWMEMLGQGGLKAPRPLRQKTGALLGEIEGRFVSVLTWLDGRPIGKTGKLDPDLDPFETGRLVGLEMARLHDLSDHWAPPDVFMRPDWGQSGLLGPDPLWGRFWEHPDLDADQRDLMIATRDRARARFDEFAPNADRGLIHADLVAENVLFDSGTVAFIDFDDGAWGYRDFDLATVLIKFLGQPEYSSLRAGLCAGYAMRRPVRPATLDFMLLLRALTYPGWIMSRLDEPGGRQRSARMLDTALRLAREFTEERHR
ncbi:phosphotransferase [Ruegeria marina]|uniref:Ser/Thr protein kinase RdoA involved in Cpx stress response, MazF antagonist n=1 Tax=Ruegeria marina TaxID=639004 RepID=A0A1G7D0S6_9RHOB|nr:phosphotransferase [Ruegeria marina]SDE44630.1 Ser/Thr protein kinase RdoA involved in Cpx stress response, MazF antagonist [Ruegeria marina]